MHHSYFDQYSDNDSLINRLNPTIKFIASVTFILFLVFTPPSSICAFIGYAVLLLSLILLSKIPILFVLKRSLVVVPFVLLIAAFIPFFKPGRVIAAYSFATLKLTISYEGVMVLWNTLAKSYLAALCMILLTSSTKFAELLKSINQHPSLSIITTVLSFMYRYLFVIQDELMMMKQAKEARSVGGSRWFQTKALANMTGVLFIKAYERAEFVYLAMCSRGFDGSFHTFDDRHMSSRDILFLMCFVMVMTGIRFIAR